MRPAVVILSAALFLALPARAAEPAAVKTAVERALPLLIKGAEGHVEQKTCFGCHNQATPMLALVTARSRGFAVTDEFLKGQMEHIADFLDGNRANYLKGTGQGGQTDTAGYALWTLELGGRQPDDTTAAVAEYLVRRDVYRGHWRTTSHRPPSEVSDFTPTYLAIRALRRWGTTDMAERIDKRVAAARDWLLKTPAADTEDRVFRLWGLKGTGADGDAVRMAAKELQQSQRDDGGWGQTADMASDAYATGTALVALHDAGGLATTDPVYRRGVAYLLKTQLPDGSWHVCSRSKPFQTYYESGFPHGKDQFISMAASGWATTALALALPPAGP